MLADVTFHAADSVAAARIQLEHDRLADMLEASVPIDARSVRLTSLEDGRVVSVDELEVGRSEILLVTTGEPRGNATLQGGTVGHGAVAKVGPYEIRGRLHGAPSADAFEVARRRPWIAMTEVLVSYLCAGREVRAFAPVALLNAAYVTALTPAEDGSRAGPSGGGATGGWPMDHGTSSDWR